MTQKDQVITPSASAGLVENRIEQLNEVSAIASENTDADKRLLEARLQFFSALMQKKLGNTVRVNAVVTENSEQPFLITIKNDKTGSLPGSIDSIILAADSDYEISIQSVRYKGHLLHPADIKILTDVAKSKGVEMLSFLVKAAITFIDGDHTIHFTYNGKDEVAYREEGHTFISGDLSKAWRQLVREAKGILADEYIVRGYQIGQNDAIVIKRKSTSSSQENHLKNLILLINKKSGEPNIAWADYSNIGFINHQLIWEVTKYFSTVQSTNQNALVTLAKMQIEQSTSKDIVAAFDSGHRYQYRLNHSGKLEIEELPKRVLPAVYDVALKIGENYKIFGPAANDLQRGDLLRQALREMRPGDTLFLGEGRFDLDAKTRGVLRFPDHATVIGKGMDRTYLFSSGWSDRQGAAYQVRNGNFSDLTFEHQTSQLFEDGRTIEMYDGYKRTPDNLYYVYDENGRRVVEESNIGPFTATFDRVKFIGDAWVIYDWSSRGNTWIIRDCMIVGGRQGISMMSSGGHAQNAYILRTTFDIDTMRSKDIGHTSNRVYGGAYGVVARGGNIKVEDSEFHIKGGQTPHRSSFAPRAVGVYDGNDFESASSSRTQIELINNRWFIEGNGALDVYDIFMTNEAVKANLRIDGGSGSGPSGTIATNWTSEVVHA